MYLVVLENFFMYRSAHSFKCVRCFLGCILLVAHIGAQPLVPLIPKIYLVASEVRVE